MRVLIVTDAWLPQVNGVVRTLQRLALDAGKLGHQIDFLNPQDYPTAPLPGYPEIQLALASPQSVADAIEAHNPDALHIATEGPLGWMARHWAIKTRRPFTTCYHTRYPQYVSARYPIPEAVSYGVLRYFHNAGVATMVATPDLQDELFGQGFNRCLIWSRGVDAELFNPAARTPLDLTGPIFLCVARVAVEKNLEAFLSLDLPGSKVIVGDGPDRVMLQDKYPAVHFLGAQFGEDLARLYASADVFVFPSKTETFGLVMLEALASGTPVAAFPVGGLIPEIGRAGAGIVSEDLRIAALGALHISRETSREFALGYTHEQAAKQFLSNVSEALYRPLQMRAA
jgi:glycosyltransferase involved in cell wall biosynthesis